MLCSWVMEHLTRPDLVFDELARVLRPGGHLVILAPNAWNYVTIAQRLVPRGLQQRLTRAIYGREDKDTFPLAYKANTRRSLESRLRRAGFVNEEFHRTWRGMRPCSGWPWPGRGSPTGVRCGTPRSTWWPPT